MGFTVHDRFFMHVGQSPALYPLLKSLYLDFYTVDLFQRNFEGSILWQARVSEVSLDYLRNNDLLHPEFVKM